MSEEKFPPREPRDIYLGYHSSHFVELALKLKESTAATDAEMEIAEKLNAIIEAAFLIAASDGELTDKEFDALVASAKRLWQTPETSSETTPYRGDEGKELEAMLSSIDIGTSLQSFSELLDTQGYQKRIEYIADVLKEEELRQKAFMIAVDIAMMDGAVPETENETIHELAKAFGFNAEKTNKLLDYVEESRKKPS